MIVFVDLDGVLVNLVEPAIALHGKSLPLAEARWGFPAQIGFADVNASKFWEPLDYSFTVNLPWTTEGQSLLDGVEHLVGADNVFLLTSPWDTPGCVEGKADWIRHHLPSYRRRFFIGSAKHAFAGANKLLIDDHDPNCLRFAGAGGRSVLVPRPWNERRGECISGHYFDVLRLLNEIDAVISNPFIEESVEILFCDHCKRDTPHRCRFSGHERESSNDWMRCETCRWWRTGHSVYHPPLEVAS